MRKTNQNQNPKYQKLREKFLASKGKERKQASQEMLKMEKDMTNTVPVTSMTHVVK